MSIENTVEAMLSAWQAQLEQVRRRRLERGGSAKALAWPGTGPLERVDTPTK